MFPTQIKRGQQSPDEEALQSIFSLSDNPGCCFIHTNSAILFMQIMLFNFRGAHNTAPCSSTQHGARNDPSLGSSPAFAKTYIKIHVSFLLQELNNQKLWF